VAVKSAGGGGGAAAARGRDHGWNWAPAAAAGPRLPGLRRLQACSLSSIARRLAGRSARWRAGTSAARWEEREVVSGVLACWDFGGCTRSARWRAGRSRARRRSLGAEAREASERWTARCGRRRERADESERRKRGEPPS
jgi:hypothetical protein